MINENNIIFESYIRKLNERVDVDKYSNLIPNEGLPPFLTGLGSSGGYHLWFDDEKDPKISYIWTATSPRLSPNTYKVDFIALQHGSEGEKDFGFLSSNSLIVLRKIAAITYNFIKKVQPEEIIIQSKNKQLERIYFKLIQDVANHLPEYYIAEKIDTGWIIRKKWKIW